jgi:hypothetical protein
MTIRIVEFDPHTASDQLWAAFNETRRAIDREFLPDEPILDDEEAQREAQSTNPMVEFRRWVAMEEDGVAGSIQAAYRRERLRPVSLGRGRGPGKLAALRHRHRLFREVHRLMHSLDKTVLTTSSPTSRGMRSSNISARWRSIARWSNEPSSRRSSVGLNPQTPIT